MMATTTCTECGMSFDSPLEYLHHSCTPEEVGSAEVSAPADTLSGSGEQDTELDMDELVRQASRPNLAVLFKKGKEAGLIQAGKEYGNT